jgi:hypothetical protein
MKYLIGQDKNKQISSTVLNYESACAPQSYFKNKLTKQNTQKYLQMAEEKVKILYKRQLNV